jgi:predicted double-glycine peptidase
MTESSALARMALAAILLLGAPAAAFGGEILLPDSTYAFQVPVKSIKELREERVVKQNYDFSCGAAAVATLLTFSYDQPTTEQQAFDTMWAVGDQEHIKKFGFSLLDMQKYLASRGLHAVGYKMSLDRLRRLHIPAIALISPNGYNHFVVVRGWRNGAAIVADPRLGLHRVPEEDFRNVWNGIVFLLRDDAPLAESHYNDIADFKLIPRSVVADGMLYGRESISEFLINIPIYNDY